MSDETTVPVVGSLVRDPELRFTPGGAAVAAFRIASTPRTRPGRGRTLDHARGAAPSGAAPLACAGPYRPATRVTPRARRWSCPCRSPRRFPAEP
ncbi:single-stranded DNA-binding protein [Streptomyces sp. NPDC048269]|uniref:single-stranded DNA-binding protein n=1 Tax=Streptomyces sp. NPDC048269 TaxID=3155753 RepID=UPI003420317D